MDFYSERNKIKIKFDLIHLKEKQYGSKDIHQYSNDINRRLNNLNLLGFKTKKIRPFSQKCSRYNKKCSIDLSSYIPSVSMKPGILKISDNSRPKKISFYNYTENDITVEYIFKGDN